MLQEAIYDCLYFTLCFRGEDNVKAAWPQSGITDWGKEPLHKMHTWFLKEIINYSFFKFCHGIHFQKNIFVKLISLI